MESAAYRIAGFPIRVLFKPGVLKHFRVPAQYAPFEIKEVEREERVAFTLLLDDDFVLTEKGGTIGSFCAEDTAQKVYRTKEGNYQFEISEGQDEATGIMQTGAHFSEIVMAVRGTYSQQSHAFTNAMMLGFAFATAPMGCLLMHSSVTMYRDKGYLFLGKSGTGKSTHSRLWLKNFPGAELLNDDNPAVRILKGNPVVYGTPWSGKTPCYKNKSVPVGAMVMLEQQPYNKIDKKSVVQSFACLIASCSSMMWDKPSYNALCQTSTDVLKSTPFYFLECKADDEAAQVCKATVAG